MNARVVAAANAISEYAGMRFDGFWSRVEDLEPEDREHALAEAGAALAAADAVMFDDAAVERAHAQFRWFGNGWKVNAELPHPDSFASATQFVRPDDVAASIPCGNDPDDFVEAVRPYAEAGFTEIALVQVGGESQPAYLDWSEKTLLPALRKALG